MSRQFRSDDTVKWKYGFGKGTYDAVISSNETASWNGTTRFSAYGSFSGTAGQTSFTKPAGWGHKGLCFLHQTRGTGAGAWELAYVDFSGAQAVSDKPLQNTYTTGAQIVTLSNSSAGYKTLTVNGGVTLSAPAWNGTTGGLVVLMASKSITITGSISAGALGYRGGYGHPGQSGTGNAFTGYTGETYNAALNAQGGGGGSDAGGYVSPASGQTGGAGGAGRGARGTDGTSAGGGGGHAAAGSAAPNRTASSPTIGGGEAGAAYGVASLVTMFPGSGGGGGGTNTYTGNNNGTGGAGGGIVFLLAPKITVTGSINANGQQGQTSSPRRGGGGAGGSVLLKGENIVLGSNLVTASGGAGAAQQDSNNTAGGAGSVGRIHIDYATSYSGSSNPAIDARQDLTIKPKKLGGGMLYSNFL